MGVPQVETAIEASNGEPEQQGDDCARGREVDAFIQKCDLNSTTRIYKRHIWSSVGHKTARQFEYWQACNEGKATPGAHISDTTEGNVTGRSKPRHRLT